MRRVRLTLAKLPIGRNRHRDAGKFHRNTTDILRHGPEPLITFIEHSLDFSVVRVVDNEEAARVPVAVIRSDKSLHEEFHALIVALQRRRDVKYLTLLPVDFFDILCCPAFSHRKYLVWL